MRAESKPLERQRLKRAIAAATVLAAGSVTVATCAGNAESGVGYDISYPQCDPSDPSLAIDLPDERSFAIIGLNNGVAMSYNPCFEDQMEWAEGSEGDTDVPKANVYVNSGNPGKANATDWPMAGEFQGETCTGEDTEACAYIYGRTVVEQDLVIFQSQYGDSNNRSPQDYAWWIDVEIGNNWQCNRGLTPLCDENNIEQVESGALSRNAAVLEGMVSEFQANDLDVGIYVHPNQWGMIVENVVSAQPDKYTALSGSPAWVSGVRSKEEAEDNCTQAEFGGLGRIVISQFVPYADPEIDKNVVC